LVLVTVDHASAVVRYVRTARPFETAADTIRLHVELGALLDQLRRQDFGLLVDLREAPFHPGETLDRTIAESRKHVFRGFPRAAILVRSAMGALQLTRYVREDGLEIPVVRDEQEALKLVSRRPDAPASSRKSNRP
jgi:hypothetical protein